MLGIVRTVIIALVCGLLSVHAQTGDSEVCRVAQKCGQCQSAGPNCTWCSDTGFAQARCDIRETLQAAGCQTITTVTDSHVRITEGAVTSSTTFLSPQRVTASLFNRRPTTFTVKLRVPQHFSRSRVTLRAKNPPPNIGISISSQCRGSRGSGSRSSCSVMAPGQQLEFHVRLMMTECGEDFTTRMRLKASGISGNVRVYILNRCTCSCEFYSVWASSEPDEYCSYNGEILCGLCHCYPSYVGEHCECQGDDRSCTAAGESEVCSGHGDCVCGSCWCNNLPNPTNTATRYEGRFCQCDSSACPSYDGQICGGPERGRCLCGQCVCESDYIGPGCDISTSSDNCVTSNEMLCNGHGSCIDGQCQCEGFWSGPTCEDCLTCSGRCHSLKPCVQCTVFNTGPYNQAECESQCTALDITTVDDIDETNLGNTICATRDEDSTMMKYAYIYSDDGSMVILVNRVKVL